MWRWGDVAGKESGRREDALGDSAAMSATSADMDPHVDLAVKESTPAAAKEGTLGGWRMGLVVTASAFCGGIAVVLWNRRLLTRMREVVPVKREEYRAQQGRLWEDDI